MIPIFLKIFCLGEKRATEAFHVPNRMKKDLFRRTGKRGPFLSQVTPGAEKGILIFGNALPQPCGSAERSGSFRVGAGLGGLDRAVGMVGRGVDRIELEGTTPGVYDIVPCSGGDKDRTTGRNGLPA